MLRKRALAFVTVLTITAAGCGGSTAGSPSAPSTLGSSTGATINGTVTSLSAAAVAGPASPVLASALKVLDVMTFAAPVTANTSVTVTVVGTNISAVVDSGGRFVLENVPPGDVRLQFSGPGINAEVVIQDVQANEAIDIQVGASGGNATVEIKIRVTADRKAELEGLIAGINYSLRTFTINGKTVLAPGTAVIRRDNSTIHFSVLQNGDRVHVSGTIEGTAVRASEIKLQRPAIIDDGEASDTNRASVTGVVSGLVGSCPSIQFAAGGTAVVASGGTEFKDGGCGFVQDGLTVEVTGTNVGGSIAATRISISQEVTLKGASLGIAGACPTRTFTVNGTAVRTIAATEYKRSSCTALDTATYVEVEGFRHTDGSIIARKVESDEEELELKGTISSLTPGCPNVTFVVNAKKVVASSATSFKPSCSAVVDGATAEVEGILQQDGSVRAKKVEIEVEDDDDGGGGPGGRGGGSGGN